ncbi:MAG: hypothetical protein ABIH99_02900, partial [Candidatus Micrarchaeota archaeon]
FQRMIAFSSFEGKLRQVLDSLSPENLTIALKYYANADETQARCFLRAAAPSGSYPTKSAIFDKLFMAAPPKLVESMVKIVSSISTESVNESALSPYYFLRGVSCTKTIDAIVAHTNIDTLCNILGRIKSYISNRDDNCAKDLAYKMLGSFEPSCLARLFTLGSSHTDMLLDSVVSHRDSSKRESDFRISISNDAGKLLSALAINVNVFSTVFDNASASSTSSLWNFLSVDSNALFLTCVDKLAEDKTKIGASETAAQICEKIGEYSRAVKIRKANDLKGGDLHLLPPRPEAVGAKTGVPNGGAIPNKQ